MHLWLRMLFSCLVDADFLDTEAFMDGDKADTRKGYRDLLSLLTDFDLYMAKNPLPQNLRQSTLFALTSCASVAKKPR